MTSWRIIEGDCRERLADLDAGSVQTCVTSPPYFGLRDYGHDGQIGSEPNLAEYTTALRSVFREVRRVLADDGTLWLNLGDTYGKDKSLIGVPWKMAEHLKRDGWTLRLDIIWSKLNPMPESATDRPTRAHEYLFLLSKGPRYFYDAQAIAEDAQPSGWAKQRAAGVDTWAYGRAAGGTGVNNTNGVGGTFGTEGKRNKRSVWAVPTQPFPGAHFATFPPDLILPCILAGSREGDTVLDPFNGAGTTGMVALRHNRSYIGCELNPEYVRLARDRIIADSPLLNTHAEAA